MIQPTQMATQGGSRNPENLRCLSLILVCFLINKTDVPFHRTRQREIAAIITILWEEKSRDVSVGAGLAYSLDMTKKSVAPAPSEEVRNILAV